MVKQLKFCYRLDAAADFVIGARVLLPALLHREAYAYSAGIVGAVGLSWGILLLRAARKPLERTWILAPTILVIFLITTVYLHALLSQSIPARTGIVSGLAGIVISTVNVFVYISWRKSGGASGLDS